MPIEIPELPVRPDPAPGEGTAPPGAARRDDPARDARPSIKDLPSARWYGVYPALVTSNQDPDGLGRVRVRLPWAPDSASLDGGQKEQRYEAWARLATLAAGRARGSWFLPEIDDEVLVAFEAGDASRPIVVGALWNGVDAPPVVADAQNTVKLLRTRSGSEIRFVDQPGGETVALTTAGGQSVTLTTAGGGTVILTDGHANAVTLAPSGVTVQSPATVRVAASVITLDAGAIHLRSPLVRCDGTIQGTTLVVQNVVASSYTPGAGNLW